MAMNSFQQIRSVLLAERDVASQLSTILRAERQALTSSDTDMIREMTAKKQPLIVKLDQLGRQRDAVLQAEGFSSGKGSIDAFIDNQTAENAAELNVILKSLKIAAQSCRDDNQVNGSIVNVNRQYFQQAMNILRGKDMNPSSYGPGGEYTSQVVRQPLLGRV